MLPWWLGDICSVLYTAQHGATRHQKRTGKRHFNDADRSTHRHLANSNSDCSWASDSDSACNGDQGEFTISIFGIALGAGASYDDLWLATSTETRTLATTETQTGSGATTKKLQAK